MKKLNIYIFLCLALILSSCIKENPNLVNPPSSRGQIYVRFINYSGDKKARSLNLNGENLITSDYGMNTVAINPPDDSVTASVNNATTVDFKLTRKVKFMRGSHNTFFALPSPKGSPHYRDIDTLIAVSSSTGLPTNTIHSYLKVINTYSDSTINYSIIEGCPNGISLFSNMRYKQVSSQKELRSGSMPITLIKNSKDKDKQNVEIIGLFDIKLLNDMQYMLIISEGAEGATKLTLLNETTNEITSMTEPAPINDKSAYIRTINLSTETISIKKLPDEIITPSIQPNQIGNYDKVSACISQGIDSIKIEYSGFSPTANALSINVNKKYSLLVSDAGNKIAGLSVVIPEAVVDYPYSNKALIRVINAVSQDKEYTLSLAARLDSNANDFTAGETIASRSKFGQISNIYPILIRDGNYKIPLTLFSNTSPAHLISSTSYKFEAGKSYLVIIHKNTSGKESLYIIEDSQSSAPAEEVKPEQFFRFVNLIYGSPIAQLSFSNIFKNAKVPYMTSLSSVAPIGENNLEINGKNHTFTSSDNQRDILVATGNKDNYEIINLKTDNHPDMTGTQTKFRLLNAAPGINKLTIATSKKAGDTIAINMGYKELSPYRTEPRARSYSFYFYDADKNELLLKADEIKIVEGKLFTIILGGSKETGYTVYILQEF